MNTYFLLLLGAHIEHIDHYARDLHVHVSHISIQAVKHHSDVS